MKKCVLSRRDAMCRVFTLCAALTLSAAFTSCDKNPNDEETPDVFLIAGKFASQTGTGDAIFFGDYISAGAKSGLRLKSGTDAGEELVGKIEDGDIIFNLKGIYFSSTGEFTLSAGSSFLIYEISGTLKNDVLDAEAKIKVKTGDDWVTHIVPVTGIDEVDITGDASEQSAGLPANWMGKWDFHNWSYEHGDDCWDDDCNYPDWKCDGEMEHFTTTFIITPFSMANTFEDGAAFPIDILDIARISSTTYDIVVQGEEGMSSVCSDYPCGREDCCFDDTWEIYVKIRLEQINNNKLILYVPHDDNAFAKIGEAGAWDKAKAYSIDANFDKVWPIELTR